MSRVRSEDKDALADDLRAVFHTDDPDDDPEAGWERWQAFCDEWSQKYSYFNKLRSEARYRNGFTYLNYDYRIRSMIYTTNWIERLNGSFRRVLRMRLSMPDEESVLVLLGTVARNQQAYGRRLPYMDKAKTLFPRQDNSP
ncbi:MAG: transposase [Balneolaceae bacterium]|nr:transposase [Balneolaceae bacterium]